MNCVTLLVRGRKFLGIAPDCAVAHATKSENTSTQRCNTCNTHQGGRVLLVIVLVIVLAALIAGGLAMWIKLAATNVRVIDAPPGELRNLIRGGVMSRHVITSGTLARLEFFDWGLRLRGTVISRWIVPTWEARYDELAIGELVSLPASRIAVWF